MSRKPIETYHAILGDLKQHEIQNLETPAAADITKPETLVEPIGDADVVVSLVGIMHGSMEDFERIQWRGAENIAKAAQKARAKLIHVSAIGADAASKVPYEITKALGEDAVLSQCHDATILRPSLLFGPGDNFFAVSAFNNTSVPL